MTKKNGVLGLVTALAVTATASLGAGAAHAARPTVMHDEGAYVRLVGNPGDGTAKFQYGWDEGSPASHAVGCWVGIYDVTHSHYVWSFDTGATDLPADYFANARPTADLPNGDYKVVFFVRGTYGPATNLAEIEFPFTVDNSVM